MNSPYSNQQLIKQLIEMIVLLSADDAQTRSAAQQQLQQWKQLSPQHMQIAEKVEHRLAAIQQLQQQPTQNKVIKKVIQKELNHAQQSKTANLLLLALLIGAAGSGFFYLYPIAYLTADIKNSTAKWQKQILADGSAIMLRGQSAVNVEFNDQARVLHLIQGEIYLDVAKDSKRPFVVQTKQGQVKALGTAFSLKQHAQYTELKMLHSKVLISTAQWFKQAAQQSNAAQQRQLEQGYQADIYQDQIRHVQAFDIQQQQLLWQKHQIVFQDRPLTEVLAQLDQHYVGKIFYSDRLSAIKVDVVLSLDDPQTSLRLLKTALPSLNVLQIGPYLMYISEK